MKRHRLIEWDHRYDPVGRFEVQGARRVARLAIDEILGGELLAASAGREGREGRAQQQVTRVRPSTSPRARLGIERRRSRKRARTGHWVVAITLALAICSGLLMGSGLFDAEARFNAERVAAQQGSVVFMVPEVQGHPGAAPAVQRSGSIRQFLGMASAF